MWRPDLGDYLITAGEVLGASLEQLERLPRLDLAESALAAPFAGFGDEDAYPALELKAAVLLERLVRNHPLPDGNKRTAFALLVGFLKRNGLTWGEPDVALDAGLVERVAAGAVELEEIERWIRQRTAA
ncbi:MAG: type II toxin-antitoxin system death-on-curing family toxin [Actinomycetota bacterium]|nr:type II toxin-antitoxin system death-on-curing family toxin [Actinomycetota bacterium]